ncbi:MAG: hypothetical protein AABW90_01855 [Nanoarchaeota archaeon]
MYNETNIVAIGINVVKCLEMYLFIYNDGDEEKLLDVFKDYANNPELNFTFNDADILARKIIVLKEERLKKLENIKLI